MKLRSWGLAVMLVAVSTSLVFAGRPPAALYQAKEIAIPAKANTDVVKGIVRAVLVLRNYEIQKEEPGAMTAKVTTRGLSATIQVKYDSQKASIHYIDSDGLSYEKASNGEEIISEHYNKWVRSVEKELNEVFRSF